VSQKWLVQGLLFWEAYTSHESHLLVRVRIRKAGALVSKMSISLVRCRNNDLLYASIFEVSTSLLAAKNEHFACEVSQK
jgi:hypothetical protein